LSWRIIAYGIESTGMFLMVNGLVSFYQVSLGYTFSPFGNTASAWVAGARSREDIPLA
jgi:uncharacterized membrane protein